jgi:hypothetical protein
VEKVKLHYLRLQLKIAQRKQSPNSQKFAQSGHPEFNFVFGQTITNFGSANLVVDPPQAV